MKESFNTLNKKADKILWCDECDIAYYYREDIKTCPQCGYPVHMVEDTDGVYNISKEPWHKPREASKKADRRPPVDMEEVGRLEEIKDEMLDLLSEAIHIVRRCDSRAYDRAHGYWYAHIQGALDKKNSDFLGGSMVDMAETIEELKELVEEPEEEEEPEGEPLEGDEKDEDEVEKKESKISTAQRLYFKALAAPKKKDPNALRVLTELPFSLEETGEVYQGRIGCACGCRGTYSRKPFVIKRVYDRFLAELANGKVHDYPSWKGEIVHMDFPDSDRAYTMYKKSHTEEKDKARKELKSKGTIGSLISKAEEVSLSKPEDTDTDKEVKEIVEKTKEQLDETKVTKQPTNPKEYTIGTLLKE